MTGYVERVEKMFPKMAELLKDCESEHFVIQHFTITEKDVRFCHLRDAINRRGEYDGVKAGIYVRLCRKSVPSYNSNVMMSDTFMEKDTQMKMLEKAYGDVLIGGLGIGMILLAIQDKPEVSSIVVIEKEQEIIDLVKSQLPLNSKVTILHGDVFTIGLGSKSFFVAEYHALNKQFDTIYFDIWDNLCGDNWNEMKKLQNKFRWKLKIGGWMSCWRKEDTKYEARKG